MIPNWQQEKKEEEIKKKTGGEQLSGHPQINFKQYYEKPEFEKACEFIYVFTTRTYYERNIFRFGRSDIPENNRIDINMENSELLVLIKTYPCGNADALEKRIHKYFENYDLWIKDNSDFFIIELSILDKIIEICKSHCDEEIDEINKIIKEYYKKISEGVLFNKLNDIRNLILVKENEELRNENINLKNILKEVKEEHEKSELIY